MKNKYLNLRNYIIGQFFESFYHADALALGTKVKDYKYIKTLKTKNSKKSFHVGLYKNKHNSLFVVKRYKYTHWDLDYFHLYHEASILKEMTDYKSNLRFSEFVEFTDSNNILTLIYKYTKGSGLNRLSSLSKIRVFTRFEKYLELISNKSILKKLNGIPYSNDVIRKFAFAPFLLLSIIKDIANTSLYLKLACEYVFFEIRIYLDLVRSSFILSYYDIDPSNIIVSNTGFTIIDPSFMCVREKEVDWAIFPIYYHEIINKNNILKMIANPKIDLNLKKVVSLNIYYGIKNLAIHKTKSDVYKNTLKYFLEFQPQLYNLTLK